MDELLVQVNLIAAGAINGSIYSLLAIGIGLIFALTGIPNFAQGELMMVGAYLAFFLNPEPEFALLLGIILLAAVVLGISGGLLERGLFAHTIGRPINGFVVSLGLVIIIQSAVTIKWGSQPRSVLSPITGVVTVGSQLRISSIRVVVFGIVVVLVMLLHLFLKRTRLGTALRCCSLDREAAQLMGIKVSRMQTLTFAISTGLVGAGGVLIATIFPFTPFFGSNLVVYGMLIALVGGLGKVVGTFLLSMMLGVYEALAIGFGWGQWTLAGTFLFLLLILLIRPTGLIRGTTATGVS